MKAYYVRCTNPAVADVMTVPGHVLPATARRMLVTNFTNLHMKGFKPLPCDREEGPNIWRREAYNVVDGQLSEGRVIWLSEIPLERVAAYVQDARQAWAEDRGQLA